MKPKQITLMFLLVLGIISFLSLIGYFLALADIQDDYASPDTWLRVSKDIPDWLPEWTACPSEWQLVKWGYWPMLLFHLSFLVMAPSLMRRRR